MSHKDGRVVLSAWVDQVVRAHAREAASLAGLEFSRWVERAVMQTMARESADRAMDAARERGECRSCGYTPCGCDSAVTADLEKLAAEECPGPESLVTRCSPPSPELCAPCLARALLPRWQKLETGLREVVALTSDRRAIMLVGVVHFAAVRAAALAALDAAEGP